MGVFSLQRVKILCIISFWLVSIVANFLNSVSFKTPNVVSLSFLDVSSSLL